MSTDPSKEILHAFNSNLPAELQETWTELLRRRDEETLTEDEYAELLRLTEVVEEIQVERVAELIRSAQLHRISLQQLMSDRGTPR